MTLVQLHEKGAVNCLENLHFLDPRIFSTIIIWSSNLSSNSITGALAPAVPLLPRNRLKAIIGDFSVFMWFAKLYFSLFEGCINNSCELQGYTFYSLKAGSMIQMVSFTGAASTTYFIRWIHEHSFIGYNYQQSPTSPMKSKMFPALPRRHGVGSHALGTCYQPRPSPLDTSSHCTLPRFPSICLLPLSFYICSLVKTATVSFLTS